MGERLIGAFRGFYEPATLSCSEVEEQRRMRLWDEISALVDGPNYKALLIFEMVERERREAKQEEAAKW